jgi:xanthine/uracil permease
MPEPGDSPSFVAAMMYAFPILIALMLGYIFWLAAFRLRRDRVATARLARRPRRP